MVISTGITLPALSSVAALYCLQNSMVCTPWGPSAVPTGGAGVALPAGSWIFTTATTRLFAIGNLSRNERTRVPAPVRYRRGPKRGLELGDLAELELDRGLPAEDVDEHLQLELVLVDLGDGAGEVCERTFLHADRLPHLVFEPRAGLLLRLDALDLDLEDALDLLARQRRRPGTEPDEAGHTRGVAHDVPRVVIEIAAHQQVAGEDLLLNDDLLAVLELDDVR